MNSTEINKFYEEHKNKKGKDFRLEILKLSKEDMYDFLNYRYQDSVHEWRHMVQEKEIEIRRLKKNLDIDDWSNLYSQFTDHAPLEYIFRQINKTHYPVKRK